MIEDDKKKLRQFVFSRFSKDRTYFDFVEKHASNLEELYKLVDEMIEDARRAEQGETV